MTDNRLFRITVSFLAVVLWLAPAVFAQGFMDPEMMKQRLTDQMEDTITQLALTQEQDALVRPILQANIDERMKAMENRPTERTSDSWQAFREKLSDIDANTETQLAEVLNEEQMAKYSQIQEERAAQRRRRGGPPQGGGNNR